MDKSLILLKIKKFTCFNRNSFAHHFEKKTPWYEYNMIINYYLITTNYELKTYNLRTLYEIILLTCVK